MQNFVLHNPTKIIFGKDRIKALAREIPKEARLMLVYGGGSIKQNGVYDQIRQALEGYSLIEFGGVEPNPDYDTLMQGVELARAQGVDYLLAAGGGSVADGVKFMAAAIPCQGDPMEILTTCGKSIKQAVPFACVLTLPGTGSEMNNGSVISRRSLKAKLVFSSPLVFPQFSILDPVTTFSLPLRQTSNGVVDTFVHIMEQYLTYPVDGKVQDRFAEGLLLTLLEEGPKVLTQPENYDVRANLMWCATLGLNGLIGAGVPQDWATHMVGHELTALYGLDHAQTLAILLPGMMKVRAEQKQQKLLQYAERVWGITSGSDAERIDAAIEKTSAFFELMQVPTRLAGYGLTQECIPAVLEQLQAHGLTALGEQADVTPDLARKALEARL
ncbi:MAG: iron-containing alcohol dehydrogenase [Geobacter sp.]|nr:iron-containing alcohol dehydrogenase [Geobacter sp.]